jgi:predicted deacylase
MQFAEKAGVDLKKGTSDRFSLRIGELPNGEPVLMPVMTVVGDTDGPTMFFNACMHGDEILGADVLRRVMRDLTPDKVAGTVIAVPVANPMGQATRTRRNIMEMYPGPHDMNRIFPGHDDGILTERIASVLDSKFSAVADYVFDLHCASVGGAWQPYTTVPPRSECTSDESFENVKRLAASFATPLMLKDYFIAGSLVDPVIKRGGAACLVEFGVANYIDKEGQDFGIRGVTNVLKTFGVLEGDPIQEDQLSLKALHRLRSSRGGYMTLHAQLATDVEAGQLIATVENLAGEVVEEVHAPISGRICRTNTMGVVGSGDFVAFVGEPA